MGHYAYLARTIGPLVGAGGGNTENREAEEQISEYFKKKLDDDYFNSDETRLAWIVDKSKVEQESEKQAVGVSLPEGADANDVLCPDGLPRSKDTLEMVTRGFLQGRINIEQKSTAGSAVSLFYVGIFQFFLSCGIFALGSTELIGGQKHIVTASWTAAILGWIASIFGVVGGLAKSESLIRKNFICNVWQMQVLTAYLFTEIFYTLEKDNTCSPTLVTNKETVRGTCTSETTISVACLVVGFCNLILSFLGSYWSTALLDSLNDCDALEDTQLMMKFFQVQIKRLKCAMQYHH